MKWIWMFLIAVLSIVLASEWYLPAQPPPVPSYAKPKTVVGSKINLLAQADRTADFPPIEQYQSVKDRPLFFEGRRPPAEYVPEPPKTRPQGPTRKVQPPRATLSGVIRVGDNTYVMLKGVGKNRGIVRARLGEDVDGWQVETIHDDRIVLKNGEERHEIPLRSYKAVALPKLSANPAANPAAKRVANPTANPAASEDNAQARRKALAARRERKK